MAGPEAGAQLGKDLERRGIELHTDSAVTEVSRDGRQARFSDGTSMDADLVVTVPTHRAAEVVASAGLTGESGWVRVSPETLETPEPDVYAVGDFQRRADGHRTPETQSGCVRVVGGRGRGAQHRGGDKRRRACAVFGRRPLLHLLQRHAGRHGARGIPGGGQAAGGTVAAQRPRRPEQGALRTGLAAVQDLRAPTKVTAEHAENAEVGTFQT